MPDFGHPDWQSTVAWEGDALANEGLDMSTSPVVRGPFNVSRWHAVDYFGQCTLDTGDALRVTFEWALDAAISASMGEEQFVMRSGQVAHVSFPNRGPFLQVTHENSGPDAGDLATLRLLPTNRLLGPVASPNEIILLALSGFSVAAGVTEVFVLPFYFGWATIYVNTAATAWSAIGRGTDFAGTNFQWYRETVLADGRRPKTLILPPFRNEVALTNNDAAARTFDCLVTQNYG